MKKTFAVFALFLLSSLAFSFAIATFLSSNNPTAESKPDVTRYTYEIVQMYPHDSTAFTQGLLYSDGFIYEGTGLNGYSSLRQANLSTGMVTQQIELPHEYYGEGIAEVNDTIIQLTWTSKIGFIYNKTTLAYTSNFSYPFEGWGLTYDGNWLILSDGSEKLYFLDPMTFQINKQVTVRDGNNSINNINELEYVNGTIFANIWKQQEIAIIDPNTGQVKAWIDLTGIYYSPSYPTEEVLNGIAYDKINNRLFVTGKNWPTLYEIKIIPETS